MEVASPHALAQAVGYIKYARNKEGGVYFRGQHTLYPGMNPSLFRGVQRIGTIKQHQALLSKYIKAAVSAEAFLGSTPEYTREPLLQHYGVKTRWIDLVDNVWTALWFACQEAESTGPHGKYLHFIPSEQRYAYIVLMQGGAETSNFDKPGLTSNDKTHVIDLRRAAPSLYLRPHAQHAILMRRRTYETVDSIDLADLIVGVIRIKARLARSWLGQGDLVTTHHVFPPPVYDLGYKIFLKSAPAGNESVGTIHHIGA